MSHRKISPALSTRSTETDTTVDAVVELTDQEMPPGSMPRAARISAMRASFERRAVGVEKAVKRAGGEVVERAWINQTLSVRLPCKALERVAELDEVLRLDAPRGIKPEG